MKKLAYLLILGTILASCMTNNDRFKITGTVKGVDTGMVFLQKNDMEKWVNIDSVKLVKGEFTFTGKVEFPEMYHIVMAGDQVIVPFFMENANIEIQVFPDSLDKSVIKGSVTQDIYRKYLAMNDSLNVQMDEVYAKYKKARDAKDTLGMARYDSISVVLDGVMKKQVQDFATTNNKTVVSPFLVIRNSWQFDLPELEALVSKMDTSLNRSQYLMLLQKRVAILKSVEVGQVAPDFTMNDSLGKPVTLSSLKGRIVLVDFWASWCGPCRAENPNVVKAYQAYSTKGFEILGCSFDQNREKWIKATKDDHLTWMHVSDLKGWANAAGKLYGINSIPANVLLDKDQKIIARNLRGEDLMNKLAEVLGPVTPEKKGIRRK